MTKASLLGKCPVPVLVFLMSTSLPPTPPSPRHLCAAVLLPTCLYVFVATPSSSHLPVLASQSACFCVTPGYFCPCAATHPHPCAPTLTSLIPIFSRLPIPAPTPRVRLCVYVSCMSPYTWVTVPLSGYESL